jgi:hypothetical protein
MTFSFLEKEAKNRARAPNENYTADNFDSLKNSQFLAPRKSLIFSGFAFGTIALKIKFSKHSDE